MTNNKDPNQKQPGEKEPGKFHYNPGNMSGKTVGAAKEESQHSNGDRVGPDQQDKKTKPSETITDTIDSVKNSVGDAVDRGQAAVSLATAAAGDMAKSASHQITTFASELEAMTKRNPLGILAGAVMAGVLIGFLARGRAA
jgi:hypothetical protein